MRHLALSSLYPFFRSIRFSSKIDDVIDSVKLRATVTLDSLASVKPLDGYHDLDSDLEGFTMTRITRLGTFFLASALALAGALLVSAQKASNPAPAPVPSQILAAKKIFIANGEGCAVLGIPNLTYNEFYPLIKSWGKYELVPAPAEADLVFEIRSDECIRLSSIRMEILDPKTSILLWGSTQDVKPANRNSTIRKNFDSALGALVDNLKQLVEAPSTTSAAPNK